jgi:glyoxylase-like metal-dependent hydrolase (beta-lactamase superfamily II)
MGFWTRLFVALTVLVAIPYYWLMIDARMGNIAPRQIEIGRIRQAAGAFPGPRPVSIEYAPVAVRHVAGAMLVAGGGLRPDVVGAIAYRVVSPAGDIVIDSGMTRHQAIRMGFGQWNPQAQAGVDNWMVRARAIVFTHEHVDHVGGFLASPHYAAIHAKAVIPAEQAAGMRELAPRVTLPPLLAYGDYAAIAPGVVLVRTPGHTPGSQMIYVQLQDGREYLFTGDTASMARNVTWLRPRSHLLSDWLVPEDRPATMGWIKGLAELGARAPRLTLVYSHDLAWLVSRRGPHFPTAYPYRVSRADSDAQDVRNGDDDSSGAP